MTTRTHLRMPLGEFLIVARRVAEAVERHAERLAAASDGRIGVQTARELRELAERVTERRVSRVPEARPTARGLVVEARRLIGTIAAAARFAARRDPVLGQRLANVCAEDSTRLRSVAAVGFALEVHVALVEAHEAAIGPLLPADLPQRCSRALEELRRHDRTALARAAARRVERKAEDADVERLVEMVAEARALARVVLADRAAEFR